MIGEEQVVAEADRLVANTRVEARDLIGRYDADPTRVTVVEPGVDLERFRPPAATGRPPGPPPGSGWACRPVATWSRSSAGSSR